MFKRSMTLVCSLLATVVFFGGCRVKEALREAQEASQSRAIEVSVEASKVCSVQEGKYAKLCFETIGGYSFDTEGVEICGKSEHPLWVNACLKAIRDDDAPNTEALKICSVQRSWMYAKMCFGIIRDDDAPNTEALKACSAQESWTYAKGCFAIIKDSFFNAESVEFCAKGERLWEVNACLRAIRNDDEPNIEVLEVCKAQDEWYAEMCFDTIGGYSFDTESVEICGKNEHSSGVNACLKAIRDDDEPNIEVLKVCSTQGKHAKACFKIVQDDASNIEALKVCSTQDKWYIGQCFAIIRGNSFDAESVEICGKNEHPLGVNACLRAIRYDGEANDDELNIEALKACNTEVFSGSAKSTKACFEDIRNRGPHAL